MKNTIENYDRCINIEDLNEEKIKQIRQIIEIISNYEYCNNKLFIAFRENIIQIYYRKQNVMKININKSQNITIKFMRGPQNKENGHFNIFNNCI